MNSQPTFPVLTYFFTPCIVAILSKGCKLDNFGSDNSLKLSFTNIQGFCLNFVYCETFLNQTLLTFLLYVRQTWMTQLILAISLRGYLRLISMDSTTHMHGLAVYVKERLPFAWNLSLENSGFLLMFSANFSLLSVLLLFPLLITFFVLIHSFWSVSSNIDEVLLINLSANVFVFGDFNIHIIRTG